MKSICFIAAAIVLFTNVVVNADSPQSDLRLGLKQYCPSQPYALYLCNYGTNALSVSKISLVNKVLVDASKGTDIIVKWVLDNGKLTPVTIGSNKFSIVSEDDQQNIVTLYHMEATALNVGMVGLFEQKGWWESLPKEGTVTFTYDIGESYGKRYGIWSGHLVAGPFPVHSGKIVLTNEPSSATTPPKP